MVRDRRGGATVVAVVSGKGGVGKTNVAVNLAVCLAARQHRVVLFDADFGLANADLLLGVSVTHTLAHVVSGRCDLDDVIVDAVGGVQFVPGASGVGQLANLSEFERRKVLDILGVLDQRGDILVVDCAAGISRNVTAFALAADHILLVTTPEPTALTDAYAVAKTLHRQECSATIAAVVNQAASRTEAREVHQRLSSVADKFLGLPVDLGGYILHDEHVPRAVRERAPVVLRYPRCPASSCLMAVAGSLARQTGAVGREESFFRRVVNLFF
jgi:flagellar biosynthesis protein FlhG